MAICQALQNLDFQFKMLVKKSVKMNPVSQAPVNYDLVKDPVGAIFDEVKLMYDQFDFVLPFLALMKEAKVQRRLTAEGKREWVLGMHKEMIERADFDKEQKQIALASGPALLEVFLNRFNRKTVFLRSPLAFYKYVRHDQDYRVDVDFFIKTALNEMSQDLKEKNCIRLIELVYDVHFYCLRHQNIEDLLDGVMEQMPWEISEKVLFQGVSACVLKGFEEVQNRDFRYLDPFVVDPSEDDKCCSCCTIL